MPSPSIPVSITSPPKIYFSGLKPMPLPLEFAAFKGWDKSLSELAGNIFDPATTFADIKWLQSVWDGPIIALGAKAVLIGRAYLYGIMANGEDGVEKAIEILRKEFVNTMALTGNRTLDEIRACGAIMRDQ